jgi:uncharacterized protein
MNKWIPIPFILALFFCGDLGLAQTQSGESATQQQQLNALERNASSGDVKAQVMLGTAYASGDGVQADEAEAVKWFRRAAEQGDSAGEYSLGEMYATGRGVPVDYAEAAKWLKKSAEQGDPRGEFNLAALYVEGKGVQEDKAEAAKWLRKSADQGFAAGQFGLGVMYAHGNGVPQDEAEAVKWYRKAMDQGESQAMNNLAFLLATSRDAKIRNTKDAVVIALKAVESDPQQPAYLDTLATAYYEDGQSEKAVDIEIRALALSPDKISYKNALEKYRQSAAAH